MSTAHKILGEIWQALNRKEAEAASGLSKPNEALASFASQLGLLGECLRYAECFHELSQKEVHGHIANFFHAARQAALKQTKDPVQMHRIARDIFFDLGLTTLLADAKMFFPERTRHLYQILVALDLKIEKCSSGVSSINPHILKFYDKIVQHFQLILDSSHHKHISDELAEELTNGFISAISEAAHDGKAGILHRQNALSIITYLDLTDLMPMLCKHFPEKISSHGFLIYSGQKRAEEAA